MLSAFYVGTTASSILLDIIATKILNKKIKNLGYDKKNKSSKEHIIKIAKFLIFSLTPILNIIYTIKGIVIINNQDSFDNFISTLKEKNEIYATKKEEKIFREEKKENLVEDINLIRRKPMKPAQPLKRIRKKEY